MPDARLQAHQAAEQPGIRLAEVTRPKAGGSIRGIGEKFSVNAANGTASVVIPVATPAGRSGFGPELTLHYDSGNGNGSFGLGWTLGLPAITRRTDKGLPRYLDADDSDIFILSGAEDLAPVMVETSTGWKPEVVANRTIATGEYRIERYRPRIEGLFARIERWTHVSDPTETFWRSISKDNVRTVYGASGNSRIADPADPTRIFSWLISESRDDKGNAIVYEYQAEDSRGVRDWNRSCEASRDKNPATRTAERHIKRIKYGNRTSALLQPDLSKARWLFEIVFDYGEGHCVLAKPDARGNVFATASAKPQSDWPVRQDPFSSRRSGFEVRNYRLCRQILVFHHFDELSSTGAGIDYLARSTDFTYAEDPVASKLKAAEQCGYVWQQDANAFLRRSLPQLEFSYSPFPDAEALAAAPLQEMDRQAVENLPYGLNGPAGQATLWADLFGEGIAGVVVRRDGSLAYKRNLGDGRLGELKELEWAPLEVTAGVTATLQDVSATGTLAWVVKDGTYTFDARDRSWTYRAFDQQAAVDHADPRLDLTDQTGDGLSDLLQVESRQSTIYRSLAERGFEQPQFSWLPPEEPPTDPVYLADMTGDGLADLVTVMEGRVRYHPSLGYGRFGPAITMGGSPSFGEDFDPARIRFVDADGSGPTDLLYLAADGVRLFRNQGGNGFSAPILLPQLARVGLEDDLSIVDLLGQGTPCLAWSSRLQERAPRPLLFVDPMQGVKPHLLTGYSNNLGAEVTFHYVSSTRFYLADEQAGNPWLTLLPFPVHVVDRIETHDKISRNRLVTRYAYHEGYWDPADRELRGFGMVEKWDGEQLGTLEGTTIQPAASGEPDVPPVFVRTWYHTGVYFGRDRVSSFFAGLSGSGAARSYFREPGISDATANSLLLPDTILPDGLSLEEERQACRALKGSMLRQETYGLDKSTGSQLPFTVTEQNFDVRCLQPGVKGRYGVFHVGPREALHFHYDRANVPVLGGQILAPGSPTAGANWQLDPRIQHEITLEVDEFGNVLSSAAIAYGRRFDDANPALDVEDRARQRLIFITGRSAQFTNPILDKPDDYRAPLPAEMTEWEIRRPVQDRSATGIVAPYSFDTIAAAVAQAADGKHDVAPEDDAFSAVQESAKLTPAKSVEYFRRLTTRTRILYRPDDLGASLSDSQALLELGTLQPMALHGQTFQLAFTSGLIRQVFDRAGTPLVADEKSVLASGAGDGGGYVAGDALQGENLFPAEDPLGLWWSPSNRLFYSSEAADPPAKELQQAVSSCYLPKRMADPFGAQSSVTYDQYNLLTVQAVDALGNLTTAGERKPSGVIDTEVTGNDYRVLQPVRIMDANRNRSEVMFDALGFVIATAVCGKPEETLGDTIKDVVPDLDQKTLVAQLDNPASDPMKVLAGASTRLLYDFEAYRRSVAKGLDPQPARLATLSRETHRSDAGGKTSRVMTSITFSDGFGRQIQTKLRADKGPLVNGGADVEPRYATSGWTVYSPRNGKPVRQYEPNFSGAATFDFGVKTGVSPVLFYDAADRVVATIRPDGSYEKTVFGPWHQRSYDANDTCAARNAQTGDPRTDPDIASYVADYFATLGPGWTTWSARRSGGSAADQTAATRAAAHADTPASTFVDALGRTFLTVARNRVECQYHPLDGTAEFVRTRLDLDIQGRQRSVRDERQTPVNYLPTGPREQRIIMRYDYDLRGNRLRQASMEAGTRWTLPDVLNKPIRSWDSRGHNFTTQYDALRRPLKRTVAGTTTDSDIRTLGGSYDFERIDYGEAVAKAETLNLRGRVFRRYDTAGVLTNARLAKGKPVACYDFKGNALFTTRELLKDATSLPDWTALTGEAFESAALYDALNRTFQSTAPYSAASPGFDVIQHGFNRAGQLEHIDVWLQRNAAPAGVLDPTTEAPSPVGVASILYDAKGQRKQVDYSNQVTTTYSYDRETFRLTRLNTVRPKAAFPGDGPSAGWPGAGVQDLNYTYDAAGNIIEIHDDAQQSIFFRNQYVEPSTDYVYDASYRLIQATGREHLGLAANQHLPPTVPDAFNSFHANLPHPGDGKAIGTYTERYVYDAVGNFLQMQHRSSDAGNPGWARLYAYSETSLIEDGSDGNAPKVSNRLSATTVNSDGAPSYVDPYLYDPHGNMARLPHLGGMAGTANMSWDFQDRLIGSDLGGGGDAAFVYDAAGDRVRKLWDKPGSTVEERLYLGGFELFRRHTAQTLSSIDNTTTVLERETLHVTADKQRIALAETRTADPDGTDKASAQLIRYQHADHLGSSCVELDDQARVVSAEQYGTYGSTMYQAVRSQLETKKRFRFTGRERDKNTGLSYHSSRYYADWIGTWISADPLGLAGGINLYNYCRRNPLVFTDTAGTKEEHIRFTEKDVRRHVESHQVLGDPRQSLEAPSVKPLWTLEREQRAMGVWRKQVAEHREAHGGIDLWGQGVSLAFGGVLAFSGGLVVGGLSLGGGYVGEKFGGRAAKHFTQGIKDTNTRAFLIGLGSFGGGFVGGFAGGWLGGKLAPPKALLSSGNEAPSSGGTSDVRASDAQFMRVKGQMTERAPDLDYALSQDIKFKSESATYTTREGATGTRAGDATSVDIPGGPDIATTLHTHPTSKVAMFSEGDIQAFKSGEFAADTVHSVIGDKWPQARAVLEKFGVEAPPIEAMRTWIIQKMLTPENVSTHRIRGL